MEFYCKDYPRPQLARKNWKNLNGEWDFLFDDSNCGEKEGWQDVFPSEHQVIRIPFTYETQMSGIGDETHHENVWYRRLLTLEPSEVDGKRILLHFEGSDFHTLVWFNGHYVGDHKGGYARFSFDVTNYVTAGNNVITVKAEDSKSINQPRGKQRWVKENFGCWYVQTTGIWKTVWMESVEPMHLTALKLTPEIGNGSIGLEYEIAMGKYEDMGADMPMIEATVTFEGRFINRSCKSILRDKTEDKISLYLPEENIWGVYLWSPEEPALYELDIRILRGKQVLDEVHSYFGMREIRISEGHILLNGVPLYQRLILDQGYWEKSHLTPPDEEALVEDIDKILAMGYNGVRKHMKIEDERFLYWCDVKGLLVWSEMAACYEFSDRAVEEFTIEWMEVVKQNYNHPAIITWTPFNESWGIAQIRTDRKQQHFTEGIYHLTKSFDSMRPVIVNDGWEHTVSDILTIHDYEEDGDAFSKRYESTPDEMVSLRRYPNLFKTVLAEDYAYRGQPIIISEFGGIAFSGGKECEWGYGNTVSSEEEFLGNMLD